MAFQKGRRKTGGRRVGSLNKATFAIQDACRVEAPLMIERLLKLASSVDGHIAIKAIKILLAYGFGKPSERIQLSGLDSDGCSDRVVFYLPNNPRHRQTQVSEV